jgi:hypothetical protein
MLTSPPAVGNFSETYASSMSLLIPAKDRLCRFRISDSRSRSLMSLSFRCCGASLATSATNCPSTVLELLGLEFLRQPQSWNQSSVFTKETYRIVAYYSLAQTCIDPGAGSCLLLSMLWYSEERINAWHSISIGTNANHCIACVVEKVSTRRAIDLVPSNLYEVCTSF